jgi:hypothetical protein
MCEKDWRAARRTVRSRSRRRGDKT